MYCENGRIHGSVVEGDPSDASNSLRHGSATRVPAETLVVELEYVSIQI